MHNAYSSLALITVIVNVELCQLEVISVSFHRHSLLQCIVFEETSE